MNEQKKMASSGILHPVSDFEQKRLNTQTEQEIRQGLKEISEGKVVPLSEIGKRLDRPNREKKMKKLKTYLESHTIEEVRSETGISQILALLIPDTERVSKQITEDLLVHQKGKTEELKEELRAGNAL